jgi:hypothetical protein
LAAKSASRDDLERRIFELIFSFPERIDEMETRSEESCRLLAARIVRLVEQEIRRPAAAPRRNRRG